MATAEATAAEMAWTKYRSTCLMGGTQEQREFAMAIYSKALDRQIARELVIEKPKKEKER